MTNVTLHEIEKRYADDSAPAVDRVSLDIASGEFFVLLGPSGCGKSTLLKLIAGLEEPSSGEIYFDSEYVNFVSPGDRNVAMVFQNYALYPHMTVRENIQFPLKMAKRPAEEVASSVDAAIEMLGLGEFTRRRVDELSGGQRQRVAVARAVVREPRIMLMDEPLSNLDALLRMQTREEILRLHRQQDVSIVYVTHDQVEAMTMGDRIGVMQDGTLVQVGTPEEVYGRPATRFVGGFMGSPPMNFVDGVLSDDRGSCRFRAAGIAVTVPEEVQVAARAVKAADGGTLTLGVRPESLSVTPTDGTEGEGRWVVELVESLGSERVVRLRLDENVVRVRLPLETTIVEGAEVHVSAPSAAVHLFDAEGRNVLSAAAGSVSADPVGLTPPAAMSA